MPPVFRHFYWLMWRLAAAIVTAGATATGVRTAATTTATAVAVALLAADPDQDDDNDDPPPAYITTIHVLLCRFTFQMPLLCSLFFFVFCVLFPAFPAAGTYLVRDRAPFKQQKLCEPNSVLAFKENSTASPRNARSVFLASQTGPYYCNVMYVGNGDLPCMTIHIDVGL